MKLLLLTDTPPCTNDPLGRLLNELCASMPVGSLACFTAMDGGMQPHWDFRLDWMPRRTVFKPGEFGLTAEKNRHPMRVAGMLREYARRAFKVPSRINQAVSFGREQKVDAVWAVLRGQTTVRMARSVANRLNAPLLVHAPEPFSWWLKSHIVDPVNRRAARNVYDATVRTSVAAATGSLPMAAAFRETYGRPTVSLMGGVDASQARPPATAPRTSHEFVIGIAGHLPQSQEFSQFVQSLNTVGWKIRGRDIRLRILERQVPVDDIPAGRLSHLLDLTQAELVERLADEVDAVYCAQPFAPLMEQLARFKFPYELALAMAAGRPVLFHGPHYSAGYSYLSERQAAVLASHLEGAMILGMLERLIAEPDLYEATARAGADAFHADLSLARLQQDFAAFLGAPDLASLRDPSFSVGAAARPALMDRRNAATQPRSGSKPAQGAPAGAPVADSIDDRLSAYVLSSHLANAEATNEQVLAALRAEQAKRGELETLLAQRKNGSMAPSRGAQASQSGTEDLLAEVGMLRAENEDLRARLGSLGGKHSEARGASENLPQSEVDRINAEHYVLSADLKRAEEENGRLKAALAEAETQRGAPAHGDEPDERAGLSVQPKARFPMDRVERDIEMAIALATATTMQASLERELASVRQELERTSVAHALNAEKLEESRSLIDSLRRDLANARQDVAVACTRMAMNDEVLPLRIEAALAKGSTGRGQNEPAQGAHVEQVRAGIELLTNQIAEGKEAKAAEGRMAGRMSLITSDLAAIKRDLLQTQRGATGEDAQTRELYLDLLEASLCGQVAADPNTDPWSPKDYDEDRRKLGRDWPRSAATMIGTARMRNLRDLVQRVLADEIEGDLLEAGVWRGGACIYMRGILQAHGDLRRNVWVADSFAGLPPPDVERYPKDAGDPHHTFTGLIVSADQVRENFARYNLLDDRVKFLEGWFKDTLPTAPVERLSVLRLDGDMYGSTMDTLEALYHRVSPGGFVIVDDFILEGCREAINDFRARMKIKDALEEVDGAAVYWRKSAEPAQPKAKPASRRPKGDTRRSSNARRSSKRANLAAE